MITVYAHSDDGDRFTMFQTFRLNFAHSNAKSTARLYTQTVVAYEIEGIVHLLDSDATEVTGPDEITYLLDCFGVIYRVFENGHKKLIHKNDSAYSTVIQFFPEPVGMANPEMMPTPNAKFK